MNGERGPIRQAGRWPRSGHGENLAPHRAKIDSARLARWIRDRWREESDPGLGLDRAPWTGRQRVEIAVAEIPIAALHPLAKLLERESPLPRERPTSVARSIGRKGPLGQAANCRGQRLERPPGRRRLHP